MNIQKIISVALGKEPADLVIKNGQIVNVITREVYPGGVAIAGDRIVAVGDVDYTIGENTKVIDAEEKFITPGLIDGHVHVETSLMTYGRFAQAVMPHGTTAVMSDFHEIGIVTGAKGIKAMVDEANKTPLKLYFLVPVRIPFHPGLETTGGKLTPEDVKELLTLPNAVSVSEIVAMNVLFGDPDYLKAIEFGKEAKVTLEGHAPTIKDTQLSAYASVGIRSDHESFTTEEAYQRIRNGMRLMMREGSVAKNLKDTIKVFTEHKVDTRYGIMITDDVDAPDLLRDGHLDHLIRRAIEEGLDPITALQMVTINTAENYRVDHEVGSVSPGRFADILIVSDLEKFNIDTVIANGEIIAENGKLVKQFELPKHDPVLLNTVKLSKKIAPEDLRFKVERNAGKVKLIVMKVPPFIPIVEHDEDIFDIKDGFVYPDPSRDLAQISVIERHGIHGSIGSAFIRGFNLKEGALASSMAHDNHNIVVMGTDLKDMAFAVNRLVELQGGQVAVKDEKVLAELPLPVGGLMSDEPPEEVAKKVEELKKAAQSLGSTIYHPFMFLIFIPLAAIPAYAITDKGFVDVMKQQLISPVLEYQ
ncbi:MAG: adenine deaminase [Candidatus Odinarchaeota archaeon]|nr:adenine deaminase [Candidatus Odinarchaeota archaeon]